MDFGENCYDINFDRRADDVDIARLVTAIGRADGIWGQNNSEPLIHVSHIFIKKSDIKIMGSNQDTVKIEAGAVAYMKFKAKDFIEEINKQNGVFELEVVGRANLNEWMGRVTPQLFIDDYEIKSVNDWEF